jgi:hypothetical protein
MSFDPMPMSQEDRKKQQLAHAQQMLNIIDSMGQFSVPALPKYNYGQAANQLNLDSSKDYAASLLFGAGGGLSGGTTNYRQSALQRRLAK